MEEKAIEVWGSRENLLRECLKREIEKKMHQQSETEVAYSLLELFTFESADANIFNETKISPSAFQIYLQ